MARTFVTASAEYLEFTSSCPISALPLTIGLWFKVPTDDGANEWFFYMGEGASSSNRCALGSALGVAGNPVRHISADGDGTTATSNSITINAWQSTMLIWPGVADRTLYLNGTGTNNTGNDTLTDPSTWDRLSIGAFRRTTSPIYWDGDAAMVAVWDVELSASDAAAWAAGYHPYFIKPESLVFFAPLGGLDCADDQDIDHITGTALSVGGTPTTTDHPSGLIYPSQQFIPFPSAAAGVFPPRSTLTSGIQNLTGGI